MKRRSQDALRRGPREPVCRPAAWIWTICLLVFTGALPAVAADNVLMEARSLAFSGENHRPEAISLLQGHLQREPDDTESRVFYGLVLSWEGRYDEAREQLSQVLAAKPYHSDAFPALINLELWSNHPQRAEQLAREGLLRQPNDIGLMLAEARALRNMDRRREELAVLERVLVLSPGNKAAAQMRRSLLEDSKWEASLNHSYDWFSDGRDPQHETTLSLRGPTPYGSLIGRVNRADRYAETSYQTEVDFYPHFRSGTYGYLNVGYSADGNLYPSYRVGADLFQSVGHGFELSGGYRRLEFGSATNIYTFAVAKYRGDWLFTFRGFVTPGHPGTSGTGMVSARRFFGSEGQHDFVEIRYSRGASPALAETTRDIEVLESSRFAVSFDKVLHGGWFASLGASIGQEQRVGLQDLKRYSLQGSIYYRFR